GPWLHHAAPRGVLTRAAWTQTGDQCIGNHIHVASGDIRRGRQSRSKSQGITGFMDHISLYGLNRCSTCVKARKWLEEQGVNVSFTDYRDEPLPAESLARWSRELGGWKKLVNRA